tara:strand:- start:2025 stop:3362 length:1338 start_codon:yes stop_codon:yes gene_type:complete
MMNLNKLAEISKGTLLGPSLSIKSFSIDTRTIKPNEVYIALAGNNFDGHEFISEALMKGASAAVVSKPVEVDIPHIIVDDTQEFMKDIADYNRNQFKGKVIGITGTNGKTSTKQILSNLLNGSNLCHKTIGNKNNQIGVPYSMLSLNEEYKYSVLEMGTSEPGEIEILNKQVRPDIAAITNVSMGHLDGLSDTKSIAKEKGNILNFKSESGIAYLPKDSEFFDFWSQKTNAKEVFSFGLHPDSDFRVSNTEVEIEKNLTHFHLSFENQEEEMSINGIGMHNSLNATLAVAIGLHCGLRINEIKERLTSTELPERRLAVTKSLNNSIMIDDTYNSNPASLRNALDCLEKLDKKKVCILGEMKELGKGSKKIHKDSLEYASKRADKILCLGDSWLEDNLDKSNKIVVFTDRDELYEYLVSLIDENTILLVKGSRSTKMDLIADKLKK